MYIQCSICMCDVIVELEDEEDGYELLNEVRSDPLMLVQPPEPRRNKPKKHKRKHKKDKKKGNKYYVHSPMLI